MPKIAQLDSHVADLIAAGEVVERAPADDSIRRGPLAFTQIARIEFGRFQGFSLREKRLYAGPPATGRSTKG